MMCDGDKERLHTARCQNRMPGRRHTETVACPLVTATRLPRTTLTHSTLPKPNARATSNTNFRVSACHSYQERHLHSVQQLLQKALCPRAAPPGDSIYCVCHMKTRLPHKSQPLQRRPHAPAPPEGSVYCACHTMRAVASPSGLHFGCFFSSGLADLH